MKTCHVIGAALGTTALVAAAMGTPTTVYATDAPTQSAAGAQSAAQTDTASELVITDNYPSLNRWLAGLGDATTVKVAANLGTNGSGDAGATIPAQVTSIQGWQRGWWGSDGEVAQKQVGYANDYESLAFAADSSVSVDHIDFKLADGKLTIPAGASVTFSNCTFSNELVIEAGGSATFHNCTFKGGTIKNNGVAQYTGTTAEPTNTGKAQSAFQHLALSAAESQLADAMHGYAYSRDVALELTGTNAASAQPSASVTGVEGLSASVVDGKLHLEGTPESAGTATVTVSASAAGEQDGTTENASATLTLEVSQRYTLALDGSFDAIRVGQSFGDTNYNGGFDVYVVDEQGNRASLNSWSDDYQFEVTSDLFSTGAGYSAFNAGGTYHVGLTGDPTTPGAYRLTASLTYHGATITDSSLKVRVYATDTSFADALGMIEGQPSEWDMEPYEATTSGNATIPTWLHHVYGSHESGLYGQIGNATDAFASDTLTIPAGADVTFENMKFNSSVKIVVEKGAKLTLLDSGVYGTIEVNGGTLSFQNDSSLLGDGGNIVLNEGSTLDNAQIGSLAYITDGRANAPLAEDRVVVNGTVTVKGDTSISSDTGRASDKGVDALRVNGTVVVPAGATLTVTGGDGELYSPNGGDAIELAGGTITGEGKLVAQGGKGADGNGGVGIKGNGTVSVGELVVRGGDTEATLNPDLNGGDAITGDVTVVAKPGSYTIAGGLGSGKGTDGRGADGVTITDPTVTPEPGDKDDDTDADEDTGAGTETDAKDDTDKDEDKGDKSLPQTGDQTAATVAGTALAGAAVIAAGAALKRRSE